MFKQKRRALERKNFGVQIERHASYPFRLNMYDIPPREEATLDEFEQWAIDRLKALAAIEANLAQNVSVRDMAVSLKRCLNELLPLSANSRAQAGESEIVDWERKKDHYSHFILRLAFCRSPELRSRFIRLETILFRLRYRTDDLRERAAFIESLKLQWQEVTDPAEMEDVKPYIIQDSSEPMEGGEHRIFKVDFEHVPDLVESRRVYLKQGKAYLPMSYQQSLVVSQFSSQLEAAMEATVRTLPRLDEDDRLMPILSHLSQGFATALYEPSTNNSAETSSDIRADMIDKLVADKHFPLCMRQMYHSLKSSGHAKYDGRIQLGRFLKGIGVNVDEALKFWRQNMTQVSEDKFNKEYRYNVRHQYGLEGSRINYKPMSCQEIINSPTPAPGQVHGCPFRHMSVDTLAHALGKMGVTDPHQQNLVRNHIEDKHYHIACTTVFEMTHPGHKSNLASFDQTIVHPNQYFDRSYRQHEKSKA